MKTEESMGRVVGDMGYPYGPSRCDDCHYRLLMRALLLLTAKQLTMTSNLVGSDGSILPE